MSITTYKSDVFSMLATIPENALNIYNALNKTSYAEPSLVEISTLENGFSLSVRNDASFIFDNRYLNIYEHQSTYNPNMPLRELIYYVHSIEKYIENIRAKLFSSAKVCIPTPNFVVLYNGLINRPDIEIMKLSDCFIQTTEDPNLEVKCTVYNINPGHNQELLAASKVLDGYTTFVAQVRDKLNNNLSLENSVESAIDHCINHNILRDFFIDNREKIKGVIMLDYTFEKQLADYEADLDEANAKILEQNTMIQTLTDSLNALRSWAKEHGFNEQSLDASKPEI